MTAAARSVDREQALLDALGERIRSGRYDTALRAVSDVDALADRMLAGLPAVAHEADELVGPFYDTAGIVRWRGVTRQAVSKAVLRRDLLGLRIGDGSTLFPAFQFGDDGTPLPHLREVLGLIDPDRIDPWGSALWLHTADERFGGTTAAVALREGRTDAVLAAARRAADAWAS